jgi:hypothetical protein
MSNVQSAACWARDTPLGWLLLVLHDGRCALGRRRENCGRAARKMDGESNEAKGGTGIKERRRRWRIEGVGCSRFRGMWEEGLTRDGW